VGSGCTHGKPEAIALGAQPTIQQPIGQVATAAEINADVDADTSLTGLSIVGALPLGVITLATVILIASLIQARWSHNREVLRIVYRNGNGQPKPQMKLKGHK
jgi:hypothetical protein